MNMILKGEVVLELPERFYDTLQIKELIIIYIKLVYTLKGIIYLKIIAYINMIAKIIKRELC